jgi:L,D-peptidoglycan transpeptidase YkuD (ErfK/YbiS/YcfS/YnhG family)
MNRRAVCAIAALLSAHLPTAVFAQSCPEPLRSARRLVLVTAKSMTTPSATVQLFERALVGEPWKAVSEPEPALIGKNGIGWAHAFRQLARGDEPVKVDGDKRAPAGVYRIGRSFGLAPSSRPGYLHLTEGTVCVDDPVSPAYNTITSRARVGWQVHGENMWRVPEYRRGLFVDYPTDAKARAGSCIFIHLRLPEIWGTSGCVALPEARVVALQDFAEGGAVLAVIPQAALNRLPGCLPQIAAVKPQLN